MRTRVVLFGASNLTRSFPLVVAVARALAGEPIEVMAALGHGRSFGMRSRVFARSLPGIVDCGIWTALAREPRARTLVLLTDVGNDIVYGASVQAILEWIETCLDRVDATGPRAIVTQLPLDSLRGLGPVRFRVAKTLLFPRHEITLRQVLERADAVAAGLEDIAARRGLTLPGMPGAWYGVDPIHIRRSRSREAWRQILAPWQTEGAGPAADARLVVHRTLRRARPEHWWHLGRPRTSPQPAARLPDGMTVSLY